MSIDFSELRNKSRKPTKKETKLYHKWVSYLRDSKLSEDEVHSRAASFVTQGKGIPK